MDDKHMNIVFGSFIKQGRERRGLDQQNVADGVGLSQSHYSRIENGTRGCYFQVAIKICDFLKLDINDFQRMVKENKTPQP